MDCATLVERAIGRLNLWLSGCCDDAFGYVPSARGLHSRGVGFFAPEAEKIPVEKVAELAVKAGRPR